METNNSENNANSVFRIPRPTFSLNVFPDDKILPHSSSADPHQNPDQYRNVFIAPSVLNGSPTMHNGVPAVLNVAPTGNPNYKRPPPPAKGKGVKQQQPHQQEKQGCNKMWLFLVIPLVLIFIAGVGILIWYLIDPNCFLHVDCQTPTTMTTTVLP